MTSRLIGFINYYYTTIWDTDEHKSTQIFESKMNQKIRIQNKERNREASPLAFVC
jgi:hypothetical protein